MRPSVICIDENSNMRDFSADELAGKTVIVRNQNLTLSSYQTDTDPAINLFIDGGNLLLSATEVATGTLPGFDDFGYLAPTQNCENCSKANYLKGNFIINGLILAGADGTQKLANKLYIHGRLVSFNTFTKPTPERIATVKTLLGEKRKEDFSQKIALDELFSWSCKVDIGSDGTRCKGISKKEREAQGLKASLLVDKAFGLIDMDFSSLLFR